MRCIDADVLEKEGWSLHRTVRVDSHTMEYQTKPIAKVPTIEPEPQWIPCSDKAPSEAQECWITAKDGTVCQGMFTRQYGERRDSGFICNGFGFAWLNAVAAWKPYEMPEPYQEEGE